MRNSSRRVRFFAILLVLVPLTVSLADDTQDFFQAFGAATARCNQGKVREAAGTLQALGQKVQSYPWHDIALLKAAELDESFDRPAALRNYQEIITHSKDRAADRLSQCLLALSNRGIQRLNGVEIEAALKKYYLDKVEYPPTLETLVQDKYLTEDKILDSTGKPVAYTTGSDRMVPTISRQTYTLEKIPMAPFGWKDAHIVGMSPQTALVQWPNAPSKSLQVGDKADDLEVLSVLDNGIVLGNDSRLAVLSYQ